MKGKILEYGVILGDDGLKYSFSYDDIMNLSQKEQHKLENLGVDFIPDNDTATEIYLLIKENSATQSDTLQTKITRRKPKAENFESQNAENDSENKENYYSPKSWQKSENSQPENCEKASTIYNYSNEIGSIKKFTYTSLILLIASHISYLFFDDLLYYSIFFVCLIGFLISKTQAVRLLVKISNNQRLLRIFTWFMTIAVLYYLYMAFGLTKISKGTIIWFFVALLLYYFYVMELYKITKNKFFIISFILSVVAVFVKWAIILDGSFVVRHNFATMTVALDLMALISIVFAWVKFKEIVVQRGY